MGICFKLLDPSRISQKWESLATRVISTARLAAAGTFTRRKGSSKWEGQWRFAKLEPNACAWSAVVVATQSFAPCALTAETTLGDLKTVLRKCAFWTLFTMLPATNLCEQKP